MAIELIKDVLRIEELRGIEETQALVETEIYLNPSKPNIEKILWTDGLVDILSTKVIRDRLVVTGVVKFKLVYKSDEEDNNIYTMDANVDFKEELDIEGITEDMSAMVKSNIEYIEEEKLDERKISLKALVTIEGKVEEVNHINIIKGIEEKQNLQTLKESIKYKEIYGRETSYAFVKEAFEIGENKPPIEEILKLTINAYEQESTVVEDRIIISGLINAKAVYLGDDGIATFEEEIPFNHFLELPGALATSQGEITIEVVEGGYEVLENIEGELKILDLEIKLRISGIAYSENEKNLIVDAYSTKEKVKIDKEEINLIENIKNIVHKEEIYRDLSHYEISEIYDLTGYSTIIDSRFSDDEIIVEGILVLNGIYLQELTNEINTFREELPYKFYLPMEERKTDAFINMNVELESIKTNLAREGLSVNAVIKHNIKVDRNRKLNVINSIEETGELILKKNRPSITIYMVQKDDILWDIAKRYNTTIEEILLANESINPNNILPGEKIIIEKNIDVSF